LLGRSEWIVRVVSICGIHWIIGIKAIDRIEGIIRIKPVGWVEWVLRTILIRRVEDVEEKTELVGKSAGNLALARGIDPPTRGLQNPTETISPDQQSAGKTGKSLDGS